MHRFWFIHVGYGSDTQSMAQTKYGSNAQGMVEARSVGLVCTGYGSYTKGLAQMHIVWLIHIGFGSNALDPGPKHKVWLKCREYAQGRIYKEGSWLKCIRSGLNA